MSGRFFTVFMFSAEKSERESGGQLPEPEMGSEGL